MTVIRHILVFVMFLSSVFLTEGRASLSVSRIRHDLTVAASGGYNLPSHGYYRGYNPLGRPIPANTSVHLEYSFGFTPDTNIGALYQNVTQGVGVAGCTFYNHELMGTPIVAYVFQRAELLRISPETGIDYSWQLGGSYGWKKSELIASRANIYVNVGLRFRWDFSPLWTMDFGPEFSHCSNGDTRYPNGGANLINLRLGLTGHITSYEARNSREKVREYESQLKEQSFADRMVYDVILYGGWRAGKTKSEVYAIINEPFPFFGLNFMPMYRLDRHFLVGASIDLLADRSSNISNVVLNEDREVLDYDLPPLYRQMAAGVTLRFDIQMPIFTVGAGVGGFVLGDGHNLEGIYTVFNLKTFLTDRLFLNIGYRLSAKNYTHNMTYGCGWRF